MSEYRKIVGACGWFLEREELPLIAHRIATHSAERIKELKAEVDELTEWNGISIGLKCPACDDVGWYVAFSGEQEQCEFCYTCPDSIFNRKAALQESE